MPTGVTDQQTLSELQDKDMDALKRLGGVAGLARALHSDPHAGLDPSATGLSAVEEHRRAYGANTYRQRPPKNFFVLCYENLQDPIILLLIAAALVSTVLGAAIPEQRAHGEWVEGVAIWIAVLIVVCVGAGNDYQKDRQFRKLNSVKDTIDIKVLRGGGTVLVKNVDLVVGDVVVLEQGDKVVADGLVVTAHHLKLDEASLTGESDAIKKDAIDDPWCRSGTQVSEGSGTMLITAVGDSSEWGKLLGLVGDAGSEDTPLQEKLADLAAAIGKIGLVVAVASFIALLIKWCVDNGGFPLDQINNNGPVQFFLYAVTIVVVAVPEGLPLAVTIALAYSMTKMMKDNNFVRHLAACETMGGATAICSDKTGTLTENRMTVTEGWFAGKKFDSVPDTAEMASALLKRLSANVALNSSAFLVDPGGDLPTQFVGNRTDCALLVLLRKWGTDYSQVRKEGEPSVVELYQFTSAKKMASVLTAEGEGLMLYNKGAAEWVLQRCVALVGAQDAVEPMTSADKERLMEVVEGMASRGLRCLALTHRALPKDDPSRPANYFEDASLLDEQLTLDAIVGIKDPVRAEVPEAVRVCQRAGITVRMVTGDNIHTARHIARECGIYDDGGIALEGPTFREMAKDEARCESELKPLLPKLQVLARSSPEDKLTLVSLLKGEGEVVAVTGDGTNDAPALKESDVGLAMGIAGTEVAKEAADIVILDDNFSSIVKSVLWGRSVFQSIQKFLQFQLTVNAVALVVSFVGSVVGGRIPLNVLQLLWVNLIMDTMGALALATEDPNPEVLKDKPHGREEPLITVRMWKHLIVQSLYQLFWLFFFMWALPVLIPTYAITDQCTFISGGPSGTDPTYCATTLTAGGTPAVEAANSCAIMANCGYPCGAASAQTTACPLYVPGGAPVPTDNQNAALCGWNSTYAATNPAPCSAATSFAEQLSTIQTGAEEDADADWQRVDSLLFNAFIFCQVANEVNSRRINDEYNVFEGLHRSPIFLGVLAVTIALQVVIMETPLGKVFKVHGLNGAEWGVSIAIGAGSFPVSLATRMATRMLPWPDVNWGRVCAPLVCCFSCGRKGRRRARAPLLKKESPPPLPLARSASNGLGSRTTSANSRTVSAGRASDTARVEMVATAGTPHDKTP